MITHNKEVGFLGEEAARKLYQKNGFDILVTNFFNRRGKQRSEIDFIAVKNHHLHFVEVKTRIGEKFGAPEESIDYRKRLRLVMGVKFFVNMFNEFQDFSLHIDVAGIILGFDKTVEKIKITSDAIGETD